MTHRLGGEIRVLQDFIASLTRHTDRRGVWRATAALARSVGFSDCSLSFASKGRHGPRDPAVRTTLPRHFATAYRDEGLAEVDPFLTFSCCDLTAKKIASKDLSTFPKASPKQRFFLEYAMESGAVCGLAIPVAAHDSDRFGGWIFSVREPERDLDAIVADHGRDLHLAAILAHERIAILEQPDRSAPKVLSRREQECLLWLCAGDRVADIASRLGLSRSAVSLYLTSAKRKLKARTRDQAVARAILTGEIDP